MVPDHAEEGDRQPGGNRDLSQVSTSTDVSPLLTGVRALDDIKGSIRELKWYRDHIFIPVEPLKPAKRTSGPHSDAAAVVETEEAISESNEAEKDQSEVAADGVAATLEKTKL